MVLLSIAISGSTVDSGYLYERGQNIVYCSSSDPAAGERGLWGDQYQGWQGPVSAEEVELTYKEIREYPVSPPTGVLRAQDVTVTRVPFGDGRDSKGASVGGTGGQEE